MRAGCIAIAVSGQRSPDWHQPGAAFGNPAVAAARQAAQPIHSHPAGPISIGIPSGSPEQPDFILDGGSGVLPTGAEGFDFEGLFASSPGSFFKQLGLQAAAAALVRLSALHACAETRTDSLSNGRAER